MKQNILPIILTAILVMAGVWFGSTIKEGNLGGSGSDANITSGDCTNATSDVGTTATTVLARDPSVNIRSVCNDDLGISSPNSSVYLKVGSTSTDEAAGFLLDLGECWEAYSAKWLPINEIWAVATTGSSTITTMECSN